MKRLRVLLLSSLMLLIGILSSCKLSSEDVLPRTTPIIPAYGDEENSIIFDYPRETVETITSLPVFINQYPYGQGGIETEVTTTLIEQLKNNMLIFLRGAGYAAINADSLIPETDLLDQAIVSCQIDDLFIVSRPECINVLFDTDVSSVNDIESFCSKFTSDKRVVSAYQYLNIDSPEIVCEVTKSEETDIVDRIIFTIWNQGKDSWDEIYNKSFRYAQVSWDPGQPDSGVLLKIVKIDTDLEYKDYSLISADDAKAVLKDKAHEQHNVVGSEIIYDGAIMPGYYVPCYNLYVEADISTNVFSTGERTGYVTYLIPAITIN